MGQLLRLNEFFVEGHEQEKSHVLLHIIRPSTPEEEKDKGYFFAVCEVENGRAEDILYLQRLIDDIENEYYDIDTISTPDKNALEAVLEKINQENPNKFSPDISLNCLIGVIIDKNLIFSYHGRPEVLFLYKTKNQEHKQINLIGDDEAPEEEKIFTQIIQGKISSDDYFFVSTARIIDYFTRDRVQKIIISRTPEQSAAHLEKVLAGTRNGLSFGGIIVHMQEQLTAAETAERKRPPLRPGAGQINSLYRAEQDTARTLSPSLMPRLGDRMKEIIKNKQRAEGTETTFRPAVTTEISSTHLKQHQPTVKKSGAGLETLKTVSQMLALLGAKIWAVVMWLFRVIVKIIKNFILLLVMAVNFKGRRKEILENWKREFHYFKNKYERLPLLTKILGIVSLTVAVLFVASIFYLQYNQKKAAENKLYSEQLEKIKNQTDLAESTLIYNDNATALREAEEARALLASTTCRENDQELCQEINRQLENTIAKARRMIFVEPSVLADWGALNSGTFTKILKIENQIVGYGDTGGKLAVYNLMTRENEIRDGATGGWVMAAVPKENDYAFLLAAGGGDAIRYNPPTKTVATAEISYPLDNSSIKSIIIYSQRLYSLDTVNNMIYRHNPTQNGFGVGNNWLATDSHNLRDAVDLAIDGSIYVLKQDGEIYKFNKGEKEEFNIIGLDPALKNANRIYTYNEWNNIYILDTTEQRIVVVDKSGNLIRQYQIPSLTPAADMVVEEEAGFIYLLDDNRIYQMEI